MRPGRLYFKFTDQHWISFTSSLIDCSIFKFYFSIFTEEIEHQIFFIFAKELIWLKTVFIH